MKRSTSNAWLLALCCLSVLVAACAQKEEAAQATSEPAAPAPLVVTPTTSGVSFRYVDPETGAVSTSLSAEEIPAAARSQVVVYDETSPTPPGWEHVADMSQGLPTTTVPRRGFTLRPRRTEGSARAASRGPRVTMFSTTWCGYCRKARSFFKKEGVPFSEYDVEKDPKARDKMAELAREARVPVASLQGVPIIFIDGHAMTGFDRGQAKKLLGRGK